MDIPYNNFSKFILRTPYFPFEFIEFIQSEKNFGNKLKKFCESFVFQEAIFLASPNLFDSMNKWINGMLTDKKEIEKLQYSLHKYIIRMSTRATPFGLFAGVSLGEFSKMSQIEIISQINYTRHTRLDMQYLCALAADLSKDETIKKQIKFFPNTSCYKIGDQIRYVEYHYKEGRRIHNLIAVDCDEYIEAIFNKARNGETILNLVSSIVAPDISELEAEDFINDLISNQLLVSELEPPVIGEDYLSQLLSTLSTKENIEKIYQTLNETKKYLNAIDKKSIGSTVKDYNLITENLKNLETKFELKFLYQTDLKKKLVSAKLSKSITEEILIGINFLKKISKSYANPDLNIFKQNLYERYGETEVQLVKALDTDSGIGYASNRDGRGDISPLIDGLNISIQNNSSEIKWNFVDSLLLKIYLTSLRKNLYKVELKDADFVGLETNWDDFPLTFSVLVNILKNVTTGKDKAQLYIKSAAGSGVVSLIGRFCYLDEDIREYVERIIEKEKELYPNKILAEISHLPESRTGNILLRPILRDYEIPYLARPSINKEHQIDISDLMISIRRGMLVLRSKRLKKEIIPRLSSAHNFSVNSLPIYKFLCDLQFQEKSGGLKFNWGPLSDEYEFLPRVEYKNIILSLATWNMKSREFEKMIIDKSDMKIIENIGAWLNEYKIPPNISLVDGDNKLYLNLQNIHCIKTLYYLIKKRSNFKIEEFLFTEDNDVVMGSEGNFVNEFIISYYKDSTRGE